MTEYYNAWIIDNCDKLVQAKKNIQVSVVFKDDNDILPYRTRRVVLGVHREDVARQRWSEP